MKTDLVAELCELIHLTSTDLPLAVEGKIRAAADSEVPGSAALQALETILENIRLARQNSTPICQDTGTPTFYVHYPRGVEPAAVTRQIHRAVELATAQGTLRPNAVHALTGINTGSNLGDDYFPLIHFTPTADECLSIDLLLKGGGCENVSAQYSLPDLSLNAARDLDGVRKVVLDAVHQAQGYGCAPGFLGVALGGDRAAGYSAAKEVLLSALDEPNSDETLSQLEKGLTQDANQLGIGPMGFGGKTTLLGTRITALHRLPASFFVTVCYMCWAYRRRRLTVSGGQVRYE
jgi:fumarate hydratase class I